MQNIDETNKATLERKFHDAHVTLEWAKKQLKWSEEKLQEAESEYNRALNELYELTIKRHAG